VRFDFHFTTEGWRISEANSDVPGGFIEASGFTRLVADHVRDVASIGDPSAALADAFARSVPAGGVVALVHATAFTDDRQVMVHLGRALESRGLRTLLVAPDCIDWSAEPPRAALGDRGEPVDAILRFFPAEWLPNLGRGSRWQCWFRDLVPMSNPPSALLTQTKRFPLVWSLLETPLPTWRACLPETSAVTRRRRRASGSRSRGSRLCRSKPRKDRSIPASECSW
jgi:hypothetical protein